MNRIRRKIIETCYDKGTVRASKSNEKELLKMYKEGLLMAGRLVQRWKTKSIFYNFSPAGWELMDRTIDFDDTPSSFTPLTLARGLITKAKKAGIPIKEVREIYKGFDVV